mmetsp:Transcript_9459/g.7223  ORF Transcript_9459/g.7223 Transcript_9459/m.7223 type:complete len:86 (+) Transcript_9459:807-1064(+)
MNMNVSYEILDKLWVEFHVLLSYALRTLQKQSDQGISSLTSSSIMKEEKKSSNDYEVISSDNSQDSMDQVFSDMELFQMNAKETN